MTEHDEIIIYMSKILPMQISVEQILYIEQLFLESDYYKEDNPLRLRVERFLDTFRYYPRP